MRVRNCKQNGCDKMIRVEKKTASGYCKEHLFNNDETEICSKEGCERRLHPISNTTGFCERHTPARVQRAKDVDPEKRRWARVLKLYKMTEDD